MYISEGEEGGIAPIANISWQCHVRFWQVQKFFGPVVLLTTCPFGQLQKRVESQVMQIELDGVMNLELILSCPISIEERETYFCDLLKTTTKQQQQQQKTPR